MHMAGTRLRTFAEKPAPVQICWLAYPGTTGVDGIDYRVTDPYLDPPGAPLPYAEASLWLPHCFWCYDPGGVGPSVGELPALAQGHVTFGCFNNFMKLNREVFALWARVLVATRGSRLLLRAPEGWARDFASGVLEEHGVAREHVEFVGMQNRHDYLATHRKVDIALDSFPYNGHTTSLDAFWMGVPVVTLVGDTVAGRAGLCQAHNLGLPELVASTPDQFVDIATALAGDLPKLSALRQALRARLVGSPLMDAAGFTRDMEGLFREAWRRYCSGVT